jgi:hypothetical protein
MVSEIVDNKTFKAIEGNTAIGNDSNGGEVMERTRKLGSNVVGFARPDYAGAKQSNSSYNGGDVSTAKIVVGKKVAVTASSLNIRATTGGTIIGFLKKNSKITVTKTSGTWSYFEGWLSNKYIS